VTLRDRWVEQVLLPLSARHLAGPRRVDYTEDQLIVVCLARNAESFVGAFVDHYLRLGVKHIVFLDNGSTDGTVALASGQPNVSVYRTSVSFRGNNRSMRRFLINRFGARRHWILCVDVDELFDYPYSDRIGLSSLLRYLRARSFTAMVAYLLDMLSDRPLSDSSAADGPLRDAYPYYDVSAVRREGYFEVDAYHGERWVLHNTLANSEIKRYVGGIRSQFFDLPDVYLIKHPLLFLDGRTRFVHQHFVDHASVADISGVLYHYKFLPEFRARVDDAVRTKAYASDSWEYARYQRALDHQPDLALKTATAKRLHSVNDLIADGFLHVTDAYRNWIARHDPAREASTS
jgi:hypothetical protein